MLRWPTGIGAKGNSGVALAIKQTKNSIGYVEFAQAMQAQLSYGLVQNRAGTFVKPELASFQSAAATADWTSASDFHLLPTDAPGNGAYPIAATVFVLMRKQSAWLQQPEGVLDFFKWSLERGAKDAAGLGYVPLPEVLVRQVEDYWAKTFKTGA